MMKRQWFLCVLAALLFTACRKADYRNVIPADTHLVASMDMAKVAEKSGMSTEQMAQRLQAILQKSDAPTQMKSLGSLPTNIGLNFSDKIYLFGFGDYFGLVASVADKDALQTFFGAMQKQNFCRPTEEQDGYVWTTVADGWQVAFNDNVLFVGGPSMDATLLRRAMLARLDASDGFVATPLFDRLEKQTGEMAFVTAANVLPASCQIPFKILLPENTDISALLLLGNLTFNAGNISLDASLYSENAEVEKACTTLAAEAKPVNTNLLKTKLSGNSIACALASVKGERVLKALRQDEDIRTLLLTLNMGVDADLMIRAIDGDTFLDISALDAHGLPSYYFTGKLSNTDFLKEVPYWKKSMAEHDNMTLAESGQNQFRFQSTKFNAYFGVTDNWLYVSSDEAKTSMLPNELLAEYLKMADGCTFFATFSMDGLQNNDFVKSPRNVALRPFLKKADELFRAAMLTSKDGRTLQLQLLQRDNGNLLKKIIEEK